MYFPPTLRKCTKCGFVQKSSILAHTSIVIYDNILCPKCLVEAVGGTMEPAEEGADDGIQTT